MTLQTQFITNHFLSTANILTNGIVAKWQVILIFNNLQTITPIYSEFPFSGWMIIWSRSDRRWQNKTLMKDVYHTHTQNEGDDMDIIAKPKNA